MKKFPRTTELTLKVAEEALKDIAQSSQFLEEKKTAERALKEISRFDEARSWTPEYNNFHQALEQVLLISKEELLVREKATKNVRRR